MSTRPCSAYEIVHKEQVSAARSDRDLRPVTPKDGKRWYRSSCVVHIDRRNTLSDWSLPAGQCSVLWGGIVGRWNHYWSEE